MRPFIGVLAGACIAAGACDRQAPPPAATTADSAAVAALVHERLEAALTGDTARWHRLVSDSCLWTGPALRVATTREVLSSIAANRVRQLSGQQVVELAVQLSGDLAQATYVQLVQDAGTGDARGTRFRKTDVFQRANGRWRLIGATEIAIPFRARVMLDSAHARRLVGEYAVGALDTLSLATAPSGAFTLRGRDGTVDTLLAADDSTLFQEGDHGTWVFQSVRGGAITALVYRQAGAADVVLPRLREQ